MKITSKGQVTIPIEFREKLGLLPETEVEFEQVGSALKIVKKKVLESSRGKAIVSRLRGLSKSKLSTDEIMRLTRA